MKKNCFIAVLLLASLVASAQVPGYRNGGLREELRAWWRGVWGQQATFHSHDNFYYQNTKRDEISGTTYGFVGGNVGQTQRGNNANVRTMTDEWGLPVSERSFAGKQATSSRAYRDAERVAVSAEASPLRREVWRDRHANGGWLYVGGGDAAIYGRRVSARNAYGDASGRNSNLIVGNVSSSTHDDAESSRATSGFSDSSSGSGSYGFGEVPHDDTTAEPPVGDGVLLMALMALAYAVVKRRY